MPDRPGDLPLRVSVTMDYPGKEISKNHSGKGGFRGALHATARGWRDLLAWRVRDAFMATGHLPMPPITIDISAGYLNVRQAVDTHNLTELVADAVMAATAIDDLGYTTITHPPATDASAATITVVVLAGRGTDR